METITPPMPAKRALAALDQPVPADVGPPKRISKKVRAAIDAMVSGDCKKICDAAAKVGLSCEAAEEIAAAATCHQPAGSRRRVFISRPNATHSRGGRVSPLSTNIPFGSILSEGT